LTDIVALKTCESLPAPAPHAPLAPSQRFLSDLIRYGLCSAAALGLDWGLLVGLVALGVDYLAAAATSFCAGMALAYFGSIAFVFPDRRGRGMLTEAAGFAAIGLAGLVCNQALLWFFVQGIGLNVAIAKAPTAICVFLFNFILRRSLVFATAK
jgi:putative flippase GtrA